MKEATNEWANETKKLKTQQDNTFYDSIITYAMVRVQMQKGVRFV